MSDEIARRLAAGPAHFPQMLDTLRDRLLILQLSEARIAAASFLDQRIITPETKGDWVSFAQVAARLDPAARDDAHYIFHIGHVGSTLLSRLLGCLPQVLALREPLLLRTAADLWATRDAIDAPYDPASLPGRLQVIRRLLARTFRPEQRAVVKATSFTSDIAPQLVASGARALFLTVSAQSYMRTILAGENSRAELPAVTGPRLLRLACHLTPMPFRLWSLGEGERVALAWVVEMLSLVAAEAAMPADTVLWIDFDDFLAAPEPALHRICAHFGLPIDHDAAAHILAGPVMRTYSKGPEHGYDADLRCTLLAQAAIEHGTALQAGTRWLDRLAAVHPKVAGLRGLVRG
jgi:hypothetical protein